MVADSVMLCARDGTEKFQGAGLIGVVAIKLDSIAIYS